MKRLLPLTLVFACLALGGLFVAYDRADSFGPDDEPIRAVEP